MVNAILLVVPLVALPVFSQIAGIGGRARDVSRAEAARARAHPLRVD